MKVVEVVCALIWKEDKFLICQRPEDKARALCWEFVGGKVEEGESKQDALKRECKEELDVVVDVGEEYCDVFHEYADINIHLTLFNAKITHGEPTLLEHNDMRWIKPDEIDDFEFCPADVDILEKLKRRR